MQSKNCIQYKYINTQIHRKKRNEKTKRKTKKKKKEKPKTNK